MSEPVRYERVKQLSRDGDVITSRGVDTVTNGRVLIYDFPGPPRLKRGQVDTDGILPVLAAGFDGVKGVLISRLPQGAAPLGESTAMIDDNVALQLISTLRDAARVGLVHGDITVRRLLLSKSQLYIEGYGVPWNPHDLTELTRETLREALSRDLSAATKALLSVQRLNLSSEMVAALAGARRGADGRENAPQQRPSVDASGLYAVVRRLVGGAVTIPPAGFGDLMLPSTGTPTTPPPALGFEEIGIPLDDASASSTISSGSSGGEPPELFEEPPAPEADPLLPPDEEIADPEPITLRSDPGGTLSTGGNVYDSAPGFVKDLPPGATYRAGDPEEEIRVQPIPFDVSPLPTPKRQSWRVPLLLLILFVVAGAAAYVSLVAKPGTPGALTAGGAEGHIVKVNVLPAGLPPVRLVVDKSPEGSAYKPGTIIAMVPRSVSFDAPGAFTVHGEYFGRVTDRVTLEVPKERAITLTFPDPTDP